MILAAAIAIPSMLGVSSSKPSSSHDRRSRSPRCCSARCSAGAASRAPHRGGGVPRHGRIRARTPSAGGPARNARDVRPARALYIYFSYGMHDCVNVVCSPEGTASAVLLRAGEVVEGLEIARDAAHDVETGCRPGPRSGAPRAWRSGITLDG